MASTTSSSKATGARSNPLRTSKSFTRSENQDPLASARPKRASTIQNGATQKTRGPLDGSSKIKEEPEGADTFENAQVEETVEMPTRSSVDLDDLPIELISLTDNFIESLSAKSRPTPPNINDISQMFQDFYGQASHHINTHISALLSRHTRESSPRPAMVSRTSTASLFRAKASAIGSKDKQKPGTPKLEQADQQMITADEMADRKKTRKALEQQRGTLEEAVERRLCEGIYSKIYRHRTTHDEAADDMLRSKTAALAVVGIGLSDLGIELVNPSQPPEVVAERGEEVRTWLDGARKELVAMNESRYPLGKLNHLKIAHKSIVDTLSHFHPSSSADEIMPMLIYTLITLPPEHLNVVSDLRFIERFRWEPKLFGEAAYCLTNLEAAVSFLETVDLSTLRSDEAPSGPLKSGSQPGTPRADTFPPAYSPSLTVSATSPAKVDQSTGGSLKPPPSPVAGLQAQELRNRRFSDLVNTPAQAIGAASDAMRSTADQGLKTISNSLGDSYKFVLGKLREGQGGPSGAGGEVVVPKTLEDARKLIGTPPLDDDVSVTSSICPEDSDRSRRQPLEDRMLNLIGGKKVSRDHSVDSSRSVSSSIRKSLPSGDPNAPKEKSGLNGQISNLNITSAPDAAASNPATPLEAMRNFGNSLNPMAKIAGGIGAFRPFGRAPSFPVAPGSKDAPAAGRAQTPVTEGVDLATAFPDLAANLPPKEAPKINPPITRFMETQKAGDLKIGEVSELLRDYRRLANALKDAGAFTE